MNDKDTIKAMTEWAAREENKYREKYEETGSPATLKTCEHYEDIQDICALAMEERSEVDDEIMASWDAHDDDDISTEMLIQMVADDCKCEADDVIETLSRQQDRIKG